MYVTEAVQVDKNSLRLLREAIKCQSVFVLVVCKGEKTILSSIKPITDKHDELCKFIGFIQSRMLGTIFQYALKERI